MKKRKKSDSEKGKRPGLTTTEAEEAAAMGSEWRGDVPRTRPRRLAGILSTMERQVSKACRKRERKAESRCNGK